MDFLYLSPFLNLYFEFNYWQASSKIRPNFLYGTETVLTHNDNQDRRSTCPDYLTGRSGPDKNLNGAPFLRMGHLAILQ